MVCQALNETIDVGDTIFNLVKLYISHPLTPQSHTHILCLFNGASKFHISIYISMCVCVCVCVVWSRLEMR